MCGQTRWHQPLACPTSASAFTTVNAKLPCCISSLKSWGIDPVSSSCTASVAAACGHAPQWLGPSQLRRHVPPGRVPNAQWARQGATKAGNISMSAPLQISQLSISQLFPLVC